MGRLYIYLVVTKDITYSLAILVPFNCKRTKPASGQLLALAGPVRSKFLTYPFLVVLNIIHVLALIRIPIVEEEGNVILIIQHLI